MQDEEIDNMDELIREASNSHHPVYDDKAWDKMEALLDKHLPQKDGRKRPVILYLLLLLITGAAFFALLFPWNKKEGIPVAGNESKLKSPSSQIQPANSQRREETSAEENPTANKSLSASRLPGVKNEAAGDPKKHPTANQRSVKKGALKIVISGVENDENDQRDPPFNNPLSVTKKSKPVENPPMPVVILSPATTAKEPPANSSLPPAVDENAAENNARIVAKAPLTIANDSPLSNKQKARQETTKGFANNFAVTLSVAPELSFIGLDEPGKTRLAYGGGLSYTIAKRFRISSGFYISKKIYSAQPTDYHPPKGYWTYFTDLKRVDADCKVYEIPLAASYNFKQSKNHSWFAGIGFSSFIMKSETYGYLYEDSMGRTMYKEWNLQNKNKHYFSILTISGGYQYHINRNFSIIAEPYLKLPLQGIGFGKIKLNSVGLLLTASIQPFSQKK